MSDKLIDLTVGDYLDVLKSDAPAPGGGSVSALAGAQGAGLLMMACDLTIGKEKYADFEETCREVKPVLSDAADRLTAGIDKDTEAFNMVMAAFGMPKDTEEEKAERRAAIQRGTIESTETPLANMKAAVAALEAAEKLSGSFNPNCLSDFGVGVMNLKLCVQGAYMNVRINIPGIKDEEIRGRLEKEADELFERGLKIADTLYEDTMKQF